MGLEQTVEQVTPTPSELSAWARREPVLAGLDPEALRRALTVRDQDRQDGLLAALVRLAQHGPHRDVATMVVVRGLLAGTRHRVGRYRGRLDRAEAFSVFVAALIENIAGYDPSTRPRYVANHLLSMPTGRLRRAAAVERTWDSYDRDIPEPTGPVPDTGPDVPHVTTGAVLLRAVRAGTVSAADAWLIWATRIEDMPIRHAAASLGLGYETARKRRQRAEARCAAWWTEHDPAMPERQDRRDRAARPAPPPGTAQTRSGVPADHTEESGVPARLTDAWEALP